MQRNLKADFVALTTTGEGSANQGEVRSYELCRRKNYQLFLLLKIMNMRFLSQLKNSMPINEWPIARKLMALKV